MGGYSANSANVTFAYTAALRAARDLYSLSGVVKAKQDARATEATKAVDSWVGGHRTTFDSKMSTEGTDAERVSSALVALANRFATSWSEARGEQDRINHARYVQHEKDEDSWGENAGEWIVGEDDYGAPPDNPPVPQPPDYTPPPGYTATSSPVHPEFEHVNA